MPITYPRTCKCGYVANAKWQWHVHFCEEKKKRDGSVNATPKFTTQTPFDRLLDLKSQAKSVIEELEVERDRLHAKIVQIDNILATYKRGESIL